MSRTSTRRQKDESTVDSPPQVDSRNVNVTTAPVSGARVVESEEDSEDRQHSESKRFRLASVILFVCILTFVFQTEITKVLQTSMGYQKPYFILYISHSFWTIALPAQFLFSSYLSRSRPRTLCTLRERISYFSRLIRQSIGDLYHRRGDYTLCGAGSSILASSSLLTAVHSSTAFTSQEKSVLRRHLFWVTFGMTILFMLPSYLWYVCVGMTSMANLTAIYNTSCFFAYLFSVWLLRERIVLNKVIAVFLSLLGVGIITLVTRKLTKTEGESTDGGSKSSVSLVGDVLALVCAALYGFEEVIYKKYASPKVHSITFANTLTGLMGVATCTMLWVPLPVLHWTGHEVFELPTLNQFGSIVLIATLGLIYNGCFMIVVSQTSPVFAAVGVMATIPIVALTDWVIFKENVGWGNIAGGACILLGFAVLVRENRKASLT